MGRRRAGTLARFLRAGLYSTVLGVTFALLGVGCAAAPSEARPRSQRPLLVFVASSLGDVVSELAAEFTAGGGPQVDVSAGSSTLLGRQIESGAPVDLFIAASAEPVESLIRAGLASPADREDLLANRLVAIVPAGSATRLEQVGDLVARTSRIAIGDPESVPAGRYARAALEHGGVWETVRSRLVPAVSVRAALAYVETGVVDAGLVYATDARSSSHVRIALIFAAEAHAPIRYPALIPTAAPHRAAARRFLRHLRMPAAVTAFEQAGFEFLSLDAGATGTR